MAHRSRLFLQGAVCTIALAGITVTGWAHGGDPNLIHACVVIATGVVRIVAPNATCLPLVEKAVDWSIAGVQGPPGPQGLQGPQGEMGVQGPQYPTELGINVFLAAVAQITGNTISGGVCTIPGCGAGPDQRVPGDGQKVIEGLSEKMFFELEP